MDKLINWLIAGGLVVIAGVCLGIFWKINDIKDYVNKKIDRNYERLDEVKDELEKETVPLILCNTLHAQTLKDIAEIKESTKCMPAVKLGMDLLLKKNGFKSDG